LRCGISGPPRPERSAQSAGRLEWFRAQSALRLQEKLQDPRVRAQVSFPGTPPDGTPIQSGMAARPRQQDQQQPAHHAASAATAAAAALAAAVGLGRGSTAASASRGAAAAAVEDGRRRHPAVPLLQMERVRGSPPPARKG
ncbi:unnamed protein product, partial [Prorocentrum cordatum]